MSKTSWRCRAVLLVALFHTAGRLDFVVHFLAPGEASPRSAVEVALDGSGAALAPVCSELTIKGVCFEP